MNKRQPTIMGQARRIIRARSKGEEMSSDKGQEPGRGEAGTTDADRPTGHFDRA